VNPSEGVIVTQMDSAKTYAVQAIAAWIVGNRVSVNEPKVGPIENTSVARRELLSVWCTPIRSELNGATARSNLGE
jgi:hypothetical protein